MSPLGLCRKYFAAVVRSSFSPALGMRLAACQIAACEFFDLNSTDTCGLFRALRKITPACFLVYLAWRRPDREKNPED